MWQPSSSSMSAGWEYRLIPYTLKFNFDAQTSRGGLQERRTWFVLLRHPLYKGTGIGEVGIIPGLSPEDQPDIEQQLHDQLQFFCKMHSPPDWPMSNYDRGTNVSAFIKAEYPSLRFAIETAWNMLASGGSLKLYTNEFTKGNQPLITNGLIWISSMEEMERQVAEKLIRGFRTIKLKISEERWSEELELLKKIRRTHPTVTVRVDANGAFPLRAARQVLAELHNIGIHSIEQPIKPGMVSQLASLIRNSPMPVALDEELIGIDGVGNMTQFLDEVNPKYLVLKPSLLGGLAVCTRWAKIAKEKNIGWWVTSALESNIGLSVIAQWAANTAPETVHGLGTGQLYSNNIGPALDLKGENLWYKGDQEVPELLRWQ